MVRSRFRLGRLICIKLAFVISKCDILKNVLYFIVECAKISTTNTSDKITLKFHYSNCFILQKFQN